MRMYQITLPGSLYRSVKILGVFEEEGTPQELEARALLEGAQQKTAGRGTRHVISGTQGQVRYILRRLKQLEDDARRGVTTFYDLGITTVVLAKVLRQTPVDIGSECST